MVRLKSQLGKMIILFLSCDLHNKFLNKNSNLNISNHNIRNRQKVVANN